DNSMLASGVNRPADRYRVVFTLGADIVLVAVRMEALTHASLPGNGPGRYPGHDNQYRGSFTQDYWKVTATSPNRKDPVALEFDKASTDTRSFAPITSKGFWNISGFGEGRNCTAIWSLSKPVSLIAGTTLIIEMQSRTYPSKTYINTAEHLGRFRL